MMYYFMMSSLSREKERILMPDKDFATLYDKMKLAENLTVEKMTLIVREYLRINFNQQTYRGSVTADYFMEFVRQHCPEQLDEISQKYNDIYEKRKQRIDEQLAELTTEPYMAEQVTSEEQTEQLPIDDYPLSEVA